MILEGGQIREYGPRQTLANDPKSRFAELLKTGLEGESNLSRREILA